jgi:hypothetical protein
LISSAKKVPLLYTTSARTQLRYERLIAKGAGPSEKSLLAAKQEHREIGDYDIHIEIEQDTTRKRVADAGKFVKNTGEVWETALSAH